jgi:hypothetical protein
MRTGPLRDDIMHRPATPVLDGIDAMDFDHWPKRSVVPLTD